MCPRRLTLHCRRDARSFGVRSGTGYPVKLFELPYSYLHCIFNLNFTSIFWDAHCLLALFCFSLS